MKALEGPLKFLPWILLGSATAIFLAGCCLAETLTAGWAQPVFFALILGATLVALQRSLSGQNVVWAALLVVVLSGIILSVGAKTDIPFGPCVYTDNLSPRLFDTLPWAVPLLWVVVLFNCRGVARLILRPWRKVRSYGYRVIALTCGLMVLFDFAWEPFATRANRFWIWRIPATTSSWYGTPWVNFFGWAVTSLLLMAFITPWLINKKPTQSPPNFHPLFLWLLTNLYLINALAKHNLWVPAALALLACAVVAPLAWRNAKW
ncbi:MAG TPA: carotenoid biosynthesis protein [Dongiaceae bacterium]|nr:carotenoid biosynthesis protein [Dongiaceae bacterium]